MALYVVLITKIETFMYYVYITSNPNRSCLYVGMTNSLRIRLLEHFKNRGNKNHFAGRYYCYHLVYYETFTQVLDAIAREKEIKGWKRAKKMALILKLNPNFVELTPP